MKKKNLFNSQLYKGGLTNKTIIKSISFDETEILTNIMALYCPYGFDLDPTYSKGVMHKNFVNKPKIKMDLSPVTKGTVCANVMNLPLKNDSVRSIIFDPPFLYSTSKTNIGIIKARFNYFSSLKDLVDLYRKAMIEFHRVLTNNGVFIFKCQDTREYLTHVFIINYAISIGFSPVDIFILLAKVRLLFQKTQKISRKYHSYYLVFEKGLYRKKYI